MVTVLRMEVRGCMIVEVHADDNAQKPAYLGHRVVTSLRIRFLVAWVTVPPPFRQRPPQLVAGRNGITKGQAILHQPVVKNRPADETGPPGHFRSPYRGQDEVCRASR